MNFVMKGRRVEKQWSRIMEIVWQCFLSTLSNKSYSKVQAKAAKEDLLFMDVVFIFIAEFHNPKNPRKKSPSCGWWNVYETESRGKIVNKTMDEIT